MHLTIQAPQLLAPVTPGDLGQLQVHLPSLKIVSLHGPGDESGVVSSLAPLTRQLGTKVHWIALSGVPADDDEQACPFRFHCPDVPGLVLDVNQKAVYEYLWPLVHGMPERAVFDADAWRSFRHMSMVIANEVQRTGSGSFPTLVWLQDFEMALVGPLLAMDAGVIMAHFWHAPWPAPAVMAGSPVGIEVVEALLSSRVLGFHTDAFVSNFLSTVEMLIKDAHVDWKESRVAWRGLSTTVVCMPLGIDSQYWQRLARMARIEADSLALHWRLSQQVVLGVDRLDYTKGIIERLDGIEVFLKNNPTWMRRFHYVQLAQLDDRDTPAMAEYRQRVVERVAAINTRFGGDGWEPVVYIEGRVSHQSLAAWYQAADVLLVTPLSDGLSLVAKEYVACQLDDRGALVLSKATGTATELSSGALLVDPQAKGEIAAALASALAMGVEEKRRRMVSMRHVVSWNRLHDWACGFLRRAIESASPSRKLSRLR